MDRAPIHFPSIILTSVLKGVRCRKAIRSSLKPYEPKCEKKFNNYIIILISIRLLNNQNNSYFKY